MSKLAKLNQPAYVYVANGTQRVEGVYIGKRKANAGEWNVMVYKQLRMADGDVFETILPVYAA